MKHGVGKVLDTKIKTNNLCYTTEIGDELHYVLQCQSLREKNRGNNFKAHMTSIEIIFENFEIYLRKK